MSQRRWLIGVRCDIIFQKNIPFSFIVVIFLCKEALVITVVLWKNHIHLPRQSNNSPQLNFLLMYQSCSKKSIIPTLYLASTSSFWLHVILPLIFHNRHKLLTYLSNWCSEHYMLDVTLFLHDVNICGLHWCPFLVVGLSSCANFSYHPCHLELRFILADLFFLLRWRDFWVKSLIFQVDHFAIVFLLLHSASYWRHFYW